MCTIDKVCNLLSCRTCAQEKYRATGRAQTRSLSKDCMLVPESRHACRCSSRASGASVQTMRMSSNSTSLSRSLSGTTGPGKRYIYPYMQYGVTSMTLDTHST